MTAQGIKEGEEHLYIMYVVSNSITGYFWHDMVWSVDKEVVGGFWEPNCDRSICKFRTREEAIRNMRFEVPHIIDCDAFEEVPAGDGEMLFRRREDSNRKEDSDSIPF